MRYKKLPKHKGIYQDIKSGKLYCQKRINKKLYSESFDSIREAKHWVENFRPDSPVFSKMKIDDLDEVNGRKSAKISEVWELYKDKHIKHQELTTQGNSLKLEKFILPIMENDIRYSTTSMISNLILEQKQEALKNPKSKRYNFDNELKLLRAMFNWWHDHYDIKFSCPVIKKIHNPLGVVRKKSKVKKERMDINLVRGFLNTLYELNDECGIYAMLAELQFILTSRIQEPTAITEEQINFNSNILVIDRARGFTRKKISEDYDKPTKTEEIKYIHMTPRIREILLVLINEKPKDCKYLFNVNGKPLTYRQIQYHYNKALKKMGVFPQFASTHILRYASAFNIRDHLGLDHAQAAGGWKSSKIAEHYSGLGSNLLKESVDHLERSLKLVQ